MLQSTLTMKEPNNFVMLNLYKKDPPPTGRLNFLYVDESLEYIQLGSSDNAMKIDGK